METEETVRIIVQTEAGPMPVYFNGKNRPIFSQKFVPKVSEIPEYCNEFPDVPPADAVSFSDIDKALIVHQAQLCATGQCRGNCPKGV